jgi:hypothetical protein
MTAKKIKTIRVSKETWLELHQLKLDIWKGSCSMDKLVKYLIDVEKVAKT